MTESKPTMPPFRAWVAWHPTQGVARFNHNGWFLGEDFEGAHEELTDFDDDPDFHQYCMDNPDVGAQMTYSQWLSSRGWRIVEVEVREVGSV